MRRIIAGLAIVLTIAFGLIFDASRQDTEVAIAQPPASDRDDASAAWFCAATAQSGSIILNNDGSATTVDAAFVDVNGVRANRSFDVPAAGQAIVQLEEIVESPFVAATITANSTRLSVAHRYAGEDALPIECDRTAATEKTFVDNQTTTTSPFQIVLYNPFPDDAVADLVFDTDLGATEPANFQGVVVAPRSVVVLDVARELRRREWVASHVSLRRGRIAAEALQGGEGEAATSLTAGFDPAAIWTLAPAQVTETGPNRVSIFNPSDAEVGVTVQVTGPSTAVPPMPLRVPPAGRVLVDLLAEERVPKDTAVGVTVTGDANAEVVVRRF